MNQTGSDAPPGVEGLLRLVGSRAAMAEIAPYLALEGAGRGRGGDASPQGVVPSRTGSADPAEEPSTWLEREGFATLEAVAEPDVCGGLVRAIAAFRARQLPASFVYAFDETWTIGEAIRERLSALVGREYTLVEDVWAWHIPAGGGRGWPAHRGIAHERLDRDAPEVINAWVALDEVTAERACMHAVPLDEDPGYPDALQRADAPLEAVRALPATAGDALFWNANVLHWGGRCSSRAAGPRVSCSFTLCRRDAFARFPDLISLPPLAQLDLTARMDLLARMVVIYGARAADVSPTVRAWANLTHELASRFGHGSAAAAAVRKAP